MLIVIAIISLVLLIALHEFGHFITAKAFKIKVEEFGIGYPPRIFGKKFGETLYSLNWLPFGAFVKIYGHEERIDDPRSFSTKPIWQRALVILGGVVSFWIIAAILLSIVMATGSPTSIADNETKGIVDPKVQIMEIAKGSPAENAKLEIGDAIREINGIKVDKVKQVQDITKGYRGKEIVLKIQRGQNMISVPITPRAEGDGPLGVSIVRTALVSYPWYMAPLMGIRATWNLTLSVLEGWILVLSNLFHGQGVPQGMEVRGIVGIFDLFIKAGGMGAAYFLQFIAVISVSLALTNILPIPALDGGWLVMLLIEKIKGRPISQKVEKNVSAFFFFLLLALMVFVTIKDIIRIF